MTGMVSVAAMTLTPDAPMWATIGPKAGTVQPGRNWHGLWYPRVDGGVAVYRRGRLCERRRTPGARGARRPWPARTMEAVLCQRGQDAGIARPDRLRAGSCRLVARPRLALARRCAGLAG